jgi:hypothetical protein
MKSCDSDPTTISRMATATSVSISENPASGQHRWHRMPPLAATGDPTLTAANRRDFFKVPEGGPPTGPDLIAC